MQIQSLGSLPKSQHLTDLVLFPIENTREVFMSDIIKTCQTHGPLLLAQVHYINPRNIKCKLCHRDSVRKYRKNHKDTVNLKAREYRQANLERIQERDRKWKRENYKKNKEKVNLMQKKWRIKNPNSFKNTRLKKHYGITIDEYNLMLKKQNNLCDICEQPETAAFKKTKKIKNLSIDHDHKNKKIRSLLCNKCNCLIGYARESIELLEKAIQYLKRHKE